MKKIILIVLVCIIAFSSNAQKQTINNGDSGLSVRNKLNSNFTELYNGKINKGDSYVNVKDYGAKGDGITEDRTAIINAIDALPALGGTIYLPVGKYKVSTPIVITKQVHFQGVHVLGYVTSTYYEYAAGSNIVSGGSGIAVLEFRAVALNNVQQASSSISDMGFRDLAGNNDTLVVVRNQNRFRVDNCSFFNSAVGLKIDASGDDASWANINNNHFAYNKIGLFLAKGTTGKGLPATTVSGGEFLVNVGQKGIYAENAAQSNLSNFKLDVVGAGSIGIDWNGGNSSISNIGIEMNGTASTIGIRSNSDRLLMSNISILGDNSTGIGIKIAKGTARSAPNTGNSIVNFTATSLGYGIYVADTVTGVKISNATFQGAVGIANIYLKAGSAYHQINNITANKFMDEVGGFYDYSTNSTVNNYTFIDGGDILQYSGARVFSNDVTDNYTIARSDVGKIVRMNASTAKTITIPLNVTVPFKIGEVIYLSTIGSGDCSIAIASGGTLNSASSMKKIAIQFGQAYIIKTDTDTWSLVGNLKL